MARRITKTTAAKATAPVVTEPVVEITNETMVECRNGTAGNLIYKSTLNPGYTVEWEALAMFRKWSIASWFLCAVISAGSLRKIGF